MHVIGKPVAVKGGVEYMPVTLLDPAAGAAHHSEPTSSVLEKSFLHLEH